MCLHRQRTAVVHSGDAGGTNTVHLGEVLFDLWLGHFWRRPEDKVVARQLGGRPSHQRHRHIREPNFTHCDDHTRGDQQANQQCLRVVLCFCVNHRKQHGNLA